MTRSKFKEVVERGVVSQHVNGPPHKHTASASPSASCQVIPAWNISPIKKTRDASKVTGQSSPVLLCFVNKPSNLKLSHEGSSVRRHPSG